MLSDKILPYTMSLKQHLLCFLFHLMQLEMKQQDNQSHPGYFQLIYCNIWVLHMGVLKDHSDTSIHPECNGMGSDGYIL